MKTDFAKQRETMVASQIRPNKVTSPPLLKALLSEPRESYLPDALKPLAYMDAPLDLSPGFPSARGRYLLAPMVLAQLIQLARPEPSDSVLDVACASGYSTAILARLARRVTGLEDNEELSDFAKKALSAAGVRNAAILRGDLTLGAAEEGPFDVILFNGAISEPPEAYFGQLAAHGRLVAITENGVDYKASLYEVIAGAPRRIRAFDASAPLLPGFERKQSFVF